MNTLYVFANMGKLNQLPKSGGQSSARRVMEGFKKDGLTIIPIRRHRAELQSKIGHVLEISYFALYDLFKMIVKMFFGSRKDAAFMQMTYAGALVPYEYILSCTAKILGYKCIEYLQGGLVMDTYPRGGRLHKWLFKKNIEMQSLVLFEGEDSLQLVKQITNKTKTIHFPSYIFDDKIPDITPHKPQNEINFCFFGRMNDSKNILVIIDIFNLFCTRNQSINSSLTLVGTGDNEDYLEQIEKSIAESPFKDRIVRHGLSSYEFLIDMMKNQHFYLFPTKEKAEGHSNALNEAMSQGVIPIACNYHFNKTIIGEDFLVVDGYNPKDYVDRIEWIVKNCNLVLTGEKMRRRVRDNYAYSIVNRRVVCAIKEVQ